MVTVVDALLTTLQIDVSGFIKGTRDAASASDQLENKVGDNFATILNGIQSLVGALAKQSEAGDRSGKQQVAALAQVTDSYRRVRNEVVGLVGLFTAAAGFGDMAESITRGDV